MAGDQRPCACASAFFQYVSNDERASVFARGSDGPFLEGGVFARCVRHRR